MEVYTDVSGMSWSPHPIAEGVEIKPLVTHKDHELNVTCLLVKIPAGREVPEHAHEQQADIIYPLKGSAELHIAGTGTLRLEPGVIVRVPKGTKHKIFNVTEETLVYDVFYPATI